MPSKYRIRARVAGGIYLLLALLALLLPILLVLLATAIEGSRP